MMMGRGFVHGFGPYGGCGGLIPMVVILLLAGIFILLAVKHYRRKSVLFAQNSNAIEILMTRLAKGEITQEEFEKLLKLIQ
ncbi:MAG: SHOCT domain-containing protein [Bacillota bacterium]|nr:SHOCT domain-containing protein [Bacillota bacterium]